MKSEPEGERNSGQLVDRNERRNYCLNIYIYIVKHKADCHGGENKQNEMFVVYFCKVHINTYKARWSKSWQKLKRTDAVREEQYILSLI